MRAPAVPTPRTPRLLLDACGPDDEESFVALFQDTRASRWMGDGPAAEAEDRALFGRILSKVYAGVPEVHATVAAQNKASPRLLGKIPRREGRCGPVQEGARAPSPYSKPPGEGAGRPHRFGCAAETRRQQVTGPTRAA